MEVDYKLYFWMCRLGIFAEPESLPNQNILLPKDIAQKFESGFIICKILESLKSKVKPQENLHINYKTVKDTSKLEEIVQNWTFLLALMENGYSIRFDQKSRELLLELDKTMICELVNILFEKFHVLDTDFHHALQVFEDKVKGLWILRGNSAETNATLKNRLPTPYHGQERSGGRAAETRQPTATEKSRRAGSAVGERVVPKVFTEPTAEDRLSPRGVEPEGSSHIVLHDYEDEDVDVDGGSHLAAEDYIQNHKQLDEVTDARKRRSGASRPEDTSVVLNQTEFMEGSQISLLEQSLLLNKSLLQIECS